MEYKTTKQNTYKTIPHRAIGSAIKHKLYKHYTSTDTKDSIVLNDAYYIKRYDLCNPLLLGLNTHHYEFFRHGEQAPSLQ